MTNQLNESDNIVSSKFPFHYYHIFLIFTVGGLMGRLLSLSLPHLLAILRSVIFYCMYITYCIILNICSQPKARWRF